MIKNNAISIFSILLFVGPLAAQNSDYWQKDARQKSEKELKEAHQWAAKNGYPVSGSHEDGEFVLTSIENGRPRYISSLNENAAISVNARSLQDSMPYNLTGSGMVAGVWDFGIMLETHQELVGRVFDGDQFSSAPASHSTHVGGTIIASGVDPTARGIAPDGMALSFRLDNDLSEMSASAPVSETAAWGTTDTVTVSNHAYGPIGGWANGSFSGNSGPHFLGDLADGEDRVYGLYEAATAEWDQFGYDHPYLLPFVSSGNERNDNAPTSGTLFYYFDFDNLIWQSDIYNPDIHPLDDHFKDGYELIAANLGAKNVMTIGSVNDAVSGGNRDLASATQSSFTSWGPMDDGRIKPDLVTNGQGVYSAVATTTSSYTSASGTSMAAPGGTGAGLLIQQFYAENFGQKTLRADVLKALMIHTADDIGNAGPDYQNGWGLINTRGVVDVLDLHLNEPAELHVGTIELTDSELSRKIIFEWDGISEIRATAAWIDPPGVANNDLNSTQPALMHDLDLRILEYDSSGTNLLQTWEPFVLDRFQPSLLATTGDNSVDNIEQVIIPSPVIGNKYKLVLQSEELFLTGSQVAAYILTGNSMSNRLTDWQNLE